MTRIAKLNRRFLEGAALSFREFQQMLEAYGFRLDRIAGSHHIYRHPEVARPLPIVPNGASARPYRLRQAHAIIEQDALRLDER